jgi:hypothetical protein
MVSSILPQERQWQYMMCIAGDGSVRPNSPDIILISSSEAWPVCLINYFLLTVKICQLISAAFDKLSSFSTKQYKISHTCQSEI